MAQSFWQGVGADELGIWRCPYNFNGVIINSYAVHMGDGALMVISPGTDVPDAAHSELGHIGTVTALVSPGAYHNMGLPAWHVRYPEARIFSTASGAKRIPKLHKDLGALEDLDALAAVVGEDIHIGTVPSKRHGDLVLFVTRGADVAMFTNEVLGNQSSVPGGFVLRTFFKLSKSGPGLSFNNLGMKLLGAKRKVVAAFLAGKISEHGVTVFMPCHGDPIEGADVKERLEEVLAAAI